MSGMAPRSKIFSQAIALLILPFVLVVLAPLFVVVVLLQGRPFFYTSERMRDADTSFRLYKIRTMSHQDGTREQVLGGNQKRRVTPIGQFLRRTRLDELPQIFNVLRGDIGFIGPRPPLRRHVEACPIRYRALLEAARPGITGLSTVMLHRREERLLSRCRTSEEAEAMYLANCLPRKLRIDGLYLQRRSVWLDLMILWRTCERLSPFPRAKRIKGLEPKPATKERGEDLRLAA